MNKNTKLLLVLLLSSLFFSGLSFADGPDLDDHEIVLSGPGMFLGGDSLLETNSNITSSSNISAESVPLLSGYAFSDHRVYG